MINHWGKFCEDRTRIKLLGRLKNIGMVCEKLWVDFELFSRRERLSTLDEEHRSNYYAYLIAVIISLVSFLVCFVSFGGFVSQIVSRA